MTVKERIRAILGEHAKLSADPGDPDSVGDGDDLYAAGRTSGTSSSPSTC